MMKRYLCWVLMMLLGSGCTSTSRLTQTELRMNTDQDITVKTKDGRVLKFGAGEYRIIEENFGSIQGRGRLTVDESMNKFREFDGAVAFSEIESISESHTTQAGYTGVILGGVAILMLIALSQIHIGHL